MAENVRHTNIDLLPYQRQNAQAVGAFRQRNRNKEELHIIATFDEHLLENWLKQTQPLLL